MTSRSKIPFYIAVLLLIAAGISLAVWRHLELGIPWLSGQQEPVWMVEARIDFEGTDDSVLASLVVPESPPGFRILSEQAASPGYGFSIVEEKGHRRAEWSKREVTGPQTLYFKVQLVPDETALRHSPKRPPKPEPAFWEEPEATAVEEILDQARSRSSSPTTTLPFRRSARPLGESCPPLGVALHSCFSGAGGQVNCPACSLMASMIDWVLV